MSDLGPGVATPLGRAELDLVCHGLSVASSPHSQAHPAPQVEHWRWPDIAGLRLDLVITPFESALPQLQVDAAVGCVWQWTALRDCPELLIEAALQDAGHLAGVANGERLEALAFETPKWLLAIGGPDDDALGQDVERGDLPRSWSGLLKPDCWDTEYGAVQRSAGCLAWRLPGLRAGESARHHIALAWRINDGDEQQAAAPWYVVDTTAAALLTAAQSYAR